MHLTRLPGEIAVARYPAGAALPPLPAAPFVSLTRTGKEISLVAPLADISGAERVEAGWTAFEVAGPLDFGEIGVLAELSSVLAEDEISVFVISTFDTDYLLVKTETAQRATAAWRGAGHEVDASP